MRKHFVELHLNEIISVDYPHSCELCLRQVDWLSGQQVNLQRVELLYDSDNVQFEGSWAGSSKADWASKEAAANGGG